MRLRFCAELCGKRKSRRKQCVYFVVFCALVAALVQPHHGVNARTGAPHNTFSLQASAHMFTCKSCDAVHSAQSAAHKLESAFSGTCAHCAHTLPYPVPIDQHPRHTAPLLNHDSYPIISWFCTTARVRARQLRSALARFPWFLRV